MEITYHRNRDVKVNGVHVGRVIYKPFTKEWELRSPHYPIVQRSINLSGLDLVAQHIYLQLKQQGKIGRVRPRRFAPRRKWFDILGLQ